MFFFFFTVVVLFYEKLKATLPFCSVLYSPLLECFFVVVVLFYEKLKATFVAIKVK